MLSNGVAFVKLLNYAVFVVLFKFMIKFLTCCHAHTPFAVVEC